MERTIVAKTQKSKFQAVFINHMLDGKTDYTPQTLKDAVEQNKPEFDKAGKVLDDLISKIINNNHVGEGNNADPKFEEYLVARCACDKDDMDLLIKKVGDNYNIDERLIERLAQSFHQYNLSDNVPACARLHNEVKKGIKADGPKDTPSMSFEDFCDKCQQMEDQRTNTNTEEKSTKLDFVRRSREEMGWDRIHKECKTIKKDGFTCYVLTDFQQLNDVAHATTWCVAHDSSHPWGGGLGWWNKYGGGPYYLICTGDDKMYALLHPKSHQLQDPKHNTLSPSAVVDRPSKTKIFDFVKYILQNETKDWDGKYSGDLGVLARVPTLSTIKYDFLRLITDPNCPKNDLEQAMEETDNEEIAQAVAQNNGIPYDNLVNMANSTNSTAILQSIATNSKLDDRLADILLNKGGESVVFQLAMNPKCTLNTYKKMQKIDPRRRYMIGFLRKDFCPVKIIEWYLEEDSKMEAYKNAELYRSILMNPIVPQNVLTETIKRASQLPDSLQKDEILELCYKHPNCAKQMIAQKLKSLKALKEQYNAQTQNQAHPAPFTISDKDKRDLEIVLQNPSCDPDVLAQVTNLFYKQPDHAEILMSVAKNPSTPEASILKIVERIRSNIGLAAALVSNPNCPYKALKPATELLDSASAEDTNKTRLINAIIRNKNCDEQTKAKILYRPTFENIRDNIFPESLLIPLCQSKDEDIAWIAAEQLRQVYHKEVAEDGSVMKIEDRTASVKDVKRMDRIARSVMAGAIAFKITQDLKK